MNNIYRGESILHIKAKCSANIDTIKVFKSNLIKISHFIFIDIFLFKELYLFFFN